MISIGRILICCVFLAIANGQITNFRRSKKEFLEKGVGCNSLAIYAGLDSFGRSSDPQLVSLTGTGFPGGAGGECGANWTSGRTSFSLDYSFSYTANYRRSGLNGRTNIVAFAMTRKLAPRLNWTIAADAGDVDSTTGLFAAPDALRFAQNDVGSVRGNLNEQMDNLSIVGPRRGFIATDRLVLRGIRQQYAALDTSIKFQKSARTTWYGQSRSDYTRPPVPEITDSRVSGLTNFGYITAGFGVQFLASSRTQITADFEAGRTIFSSQGLLTSGATLTVSHVMSPHWTAQIQGGIGMLQPVGLNSRSNSASRDFIGAGGVSYQGYANKIVFTASRQLGGGFSAAYPSSLSSTVAWTWEKPGNPYTAVAAVEWQQFTGGGARPLTVGLFAAGIGRRLNAKTSLFIQAVRSSDRGVSLLGTGGGDFLNTGVAGVVRGAVRVSLVYTPRRHRSI